MLRSFEWQDLESLGRGALWTLALCATSGVIGTILGAILGLAATSPSRIARWVAGIYVYFIRGIPLLVIVFFAYFGLPLLLPNLSLSAFMTAVIALTVFTAAYMAENFRGSINAVPKGQWEAADALGLGYTNKLRFVILPQARQIVVAPAIGFLIALVKDSSLVTVIGFVELTQSGTIISNLTANPILTYSVVAAFYFVICYALSRLGRWYERRAHASARFPEATDKPPTLQLEGV
ncbi:MAG: amino acid ABC transporter permease [Mycobacteriaceae bacterium]